MCLFWRYCFFGMIRSSYQKYVTHTAVRFVSRSEVLQGAFDKVFWGQSHCVGLLIICHSSGNPKWSYCLRTREELTELCDKMIRFSINTLRWSFKTEALYLYNNPFISVFSLETLGKSFHKHLKEGGVIRREWGEMEVYWRCCAYLRCSIQSVEGERNGGNSWWNIYNHPFSPVQAERHGLTSVSKRNILVSMLECDLIIYFIKKTWKPVLHAWKDYFAHLKKKRTYNQIWDKGWQS